MKRYTLTILLIAMFALPSFANPIVTVAKVAAFPVVHPVKASLAVTYYSVGGVLYGVGATIEVIGKTVYDVGTAVKGAGSSLDTSASSSAPAK